VQLTSVFAGLEERPFGSAAGTVGQGKSLYAAANLVVHN